jgi:ATP-dependent DNA helicase RecQ
LLLLPSLSSPFLPEFLHIPYQFYDNSDNLQPANSLIGQKVLQHLRQDPSLKIDRPIERMEEIRSELGYSDYDVAWKSLLSSLQEIQKVTQDEICYILEEAKTVRSEEVVLSTFHSAKGSEFSHVLVIEGGDRLTGDNSYESCVRKLYVGFTRAKDSLTILFNQRNISNDPASIAMSILQNSSIHSGISKIDLPISAMDNKLIRYKDVLDIKDLWLSHRHTLLGQDRIDYYAQKWGELRFSNNSFQCGYMDEYGSPFMSGGIAVLSSCGTNKLRSHQNKRIIATGYTIFRVERDDEFIPSDIRDKFINDHHYVVLPCLEIEESFI